MTFQRFLFLPLVLVCGQIFSQSKSLQALKTTQPPRIDGRLDDNAWQDAPKATDFIQNFPTAFNERFNVKFDHAQHNKGEARPAQHPRARRRLAVPGQVRDAVQGAGLRPAAALRRRSSR